MQEIRRSVWEKTKPAIHIMKISGIMSLKVSEIIILLIPPFKCSSYKFGNHYLQIYFVFLFFLLDFSASGDFGSFFKTLHFCSSHPHSFTFSSLPCSRVSAPLPYSLFSCCSPESLRQLSLSPGETNIMEFRTTTKENKHTRTSPHITLYMCYLPPHFPP